MTLVAPLSEQQWQPFSESVSSSSPILLKKLVGGWTNPVEKIWTSKWVHLPHASRWKFQNILKPPPRKWKWDQTIQLVAGFGPTGFFHHLKKSSCFFLRLVLILSMATRNPVRKLPKGCMKPCKSFGKTTTVYQLLIAGLFSSRVSFNLKVFAVCCPLNQ